MARIKEPTAEQEAGYRAWLEERPPHVRVVAERFEPWSLYRLKTTGDRVTLVSFGEGDDGDVSLTVCVSGDFNVTLFDRQVFGIRPEDLEPCELPAEDEATGALLSQQEASDNMDVLRALVRPDLWEMGPNGVATRRDQ